MGITSPRSPRAMLFYITPHSATRAHVTVSEGASYCNYIHYLCLLAQQPFQQPCVSAGPQLASWAMPPKAKPIAELGSVSGSEHDAFRADVEVRAGAGRRVHIYGSRREQRGPAVTDLAQIRADRGCGRHARAGPPNHGRGGPSSTGRRRFRGGGGRGCAATARGGRAGDGCGLPRR